MCTTVHWNERIEAVITQIHWLDLSEIRIIAPTPKSENRMLRTQYPRWEHQTCGTQRPRLYFTAPNSPVSRLPSVSSESSSEDVTSTRRYVDGRSCCGNISSDYATILSDLTCPGRSPVLVIEHHQQIFDENLALEDEVFEFTVLEYSFNVLLKHLENDVPQRLVRS